jgi:hypothetical protein
MLEQAVRLGSIASGTGQALGGTRLSGSVLITHIAGLICIRGCRKALDCNPQTLAGLGRLLGQGSSFHAFISQAMIGPLVTASACKKPAIQHTAVTLPIIRKCAAEV